MHRSKAFALRNIKELLRDPLSYIFCLCFPLVMLAVMTLVNSGIPEEAGMTVFRIDKLSGGICIFGQTFIMLFTALSVSKDRAGSFLVRMYASPMTSADFIAGYILPMLAVSAAQSVITCTASYIISLFTGVELSPLGLVISVIVLIPSSLFFIALGLIFGTLFNDKAAPGLCSIIISLGSFLGCVFYDADSAGGVMLDICKSLPFYYCTKTARSAAAFDLSAEGSLIPILIVSLSAAAATFISIITFRARMKAELS